MFRRRAEDFYIQNIKSTISRSLLGEPEEVDFGHLAGIYIKNFLYSSPTVMMVLRSDSRRT